MRDVAALGVGHDQQAGVMRRGHHLLERSPAGRAEALEACELRLHSDARRSGGADQLAALIGDRRCVRAGGIEPEADLAAALGDERREPVGERCGQPPLTFDFRPAPAENFGTLPPAIVMRSPVRGLTPCRGPRSATLNLPKPEKLISPPPRACL